MPVVSRIRFVIDVQRLLIPAYIQLLQASIREIK